MLLLPATPTLILFGIILIGMFILTMKRGWPLPVVLPVAIVLVLLMGLITYLGKLRPH